MDLELSGKRAAVIGASRGIGRAIAEGFVREGARLLAVARGSRGLADFARETGCLTLAADLSREEGAAELRAAVIRHFGGLDILVCNAGSGRSVAPGTETAEEWRRVLDINLFTAICALEAVRDLLAPGGAVICISSIAGRRAIGAPVAYAAAKSAVDAMIANAARPLAEKGVRIVGVAPGNILFPGSVWDQKLGEDEPAVEAMLLRDVPLRRLGRPEEIADAVLFLSSARAAFTTGTVLVVDGGQTGVA